ncbi:hypothetical protein Tco_0862607 [Tanacetum coccineum]
MDLATKLTDRIGVLEMDLQQTKKTYSTALTRLILRVKKLEKNVKTGKARRRARIRKDRNLIVCLTASIPVTTVGLEISTANIAVSTADVVVTTASASISNVSPPRVSTAKDISGAEILVYIRRSASKAKDKGKANMQESEPPIKIKKRVQVQMSIDEELAKKLKKAHDIDFKVIPSVLRYHALQNRPFLYSEKEKGSEKKTEGRLKRVGEDVVEEPAKRQKTIEASESVQEQPSEEPKADKLSQEQLQQMMLIVPEEGMHIEALQIKEDLDKLWSLVKERFNSPRLTDDKEKELWVELKRLFEPEDTDTLWKLQRYMHDPLKWWLYDTCGVHHVSTERGHDIFMLVEKDYPLTTELMTLML